MVAAEDTPIGGPRTMFVLDAHNLLYRYGASTVRVDAIAQGTIYAQAATH